MSFPVGVIKVDDSGLVGLVEKGRPEKHRKTTP